MKSIAGINKFIIVTDDRKYAKLLFPNLPIISGNIGACFSTIYNAKYCILSNSSFPYFAVQSGEKLNLVIAPKYFCNFNNIIERWLRHVIYTSDWHYQNKEGLLENYQDCKDKALKDELNYQNEYVVLCKQGSYPKQKEQDSSQPQLDI